MDNSREKYDNHDRGELDGEVHDDSMKKVRSQHFCEVCDVICATETQMKAHNELFHGDDGDFNCTECSFQGNNLERLTNHIEVAHKPNFKCNNCEKIFHN